ncbi:hypothetical protein BDK51DRAFT_34695 [Blyttiomyces helicus]|uniref:Uncharacterized protein n=1 Tax=Blyttiomyces helicus TaxID=388810 RepID=A0A4P9WKF7_9FUNG|nr:hypothetical protein BDK51DRAFT_34695 [Blyttiomyces helicus]|eukprot:RKO93461.1 hypothetical protein BDK51DRAFT_34695 [Blyttiomyces helicus]
MSTPPPFLTDGLLPCALLWQQQRRNQMRLALQRAIARKPRESRRHGKRWVAWDNQLVTYGDFVARFRLCRTQCTASDAEREGVSDCISSFAKRFYWNAQVGIGLYHFGHGCSYNVMSHRFNVAVNTALMVTWKFMAAVIKVFARLAIG